MNIKQLELLIEASHDAGLVERSFTSYEFSGKDNPVIHFYVNDDPPTEIATFYVSNEKQTYHFDIHLEDETISPFTWIGSYVAVIKMFYIIVERLELRGYNKGIYHFELM